jgi:cobalamin biosynthesis protein CobD/CbiB
MKQAHQITPVAPAPAASGDRSAESIHDLICHPATDLSTLLGTDIERAKSEVRETVTEVQTAMGAIATGATIAMAGLVVLLMSAVYGLSKVVEPWLAALIVGAVVLLLGDLMVRSAKETMSASSIVPVRTLESVNKD